MLQLNLCTLALLAFFAARVASRSNGAGHCLSASSYTHGKEATPGHGGYSIGIEWGELGASALLTVAGVEPFKGVLIYTSMGHFEEPLPSTLHFKDCADRLPRQTVTHAAPASKASVALSLHLPEDLNAAEKFVVGVVVLKDYNTWFWLNATLQDHPHPFL
jgi:hypothetical protein